MAKKFPTFAKVPWKVVGLIALHGFLLLMHFYTIMGVIGISWFMSAMPGNNEQGTQLLAGWVSLFIISLLLHLLLMIHTVRRA